MVKNSLITLLIISSNTTLRAAFRIPWWSSPETPSEISAIKLTKEEVPLLLASELVTVSGPSVFHAFTTDNSVKGVHLFST